MSFPRMDDALTGWTTKIILRIAKRSVTDFEATETDVKDEPFAAIIQPIQPQKLAIKPEGERAWKWWTLWTGKALPIDGILIDPLGNTFRVTSRSDWSAARFNEYEITEAVPHG